MAVKFNGTDGKFQLVTVVKVSETDELAWLKIEGGGPYPTVAGVAPMCNANSDSVTRAPENAKCGRMVSANMSGRLTVYGRRSKKRLQTWFQLDFFGVCQAAIATPAQVMTMPIQLTGDGATLNRKNSGMMANTGVR